MALFSSFTSTLAVSHQEGLECQDRFYFYFRVLTFDFRLLFFDRPQAPLVPTSDENGLYG